MCLFVYSSASWMVVICTEAESQHVLSAFWLIIYPNKFLFDIIFYTNASPRILRKQKENLKIPKHCILLPCTRNF